MANKTKYSKTIIAEILSELAQGKSIRSCLSPINKSEDRPCWETFRSWMRDIKKYPNLRTEYENAKTDWEVIKAKELGESVSSDTTTYRASVRTKANAMETAITNASDMAAMLTLFTRDGSGNRPIGDLPTS